MHGNVWEWCLDYFHSRLPGGTDPRPPSDTPGTQNRDGSGSRVRRGGAWMKSAASSSAVRPLRLPYEPPRRSDHIGFRVIALVER